MDAITMDFTGFYSGYELPSGLTDGVAGGLCFYEGFRGADVLFAIIQGVPQDYLVGIALRDDSTGSGEKPPFVEHMQFGFTQSQQSLATRSMEVEFTTPVFCQVSIKIYDVMGRLVRMLLENAEKKGKRSLRWDGKNDNNRDLASGVYLLRLNSQSYSDIYKVILVR
jgi:hypothetical protein